MAQTVAPKTTPSSIINLVIKNHYNATYSYHTTIKDPYKTTVANVKLLIAKKYKGKPRVEDQKIIHRGVVLDDRRTIHSIMDTRSKLKHETSQTSSSSPENIQCIFHLILKGGSKTAIKIGLIEKSKSGPLSAGKKNDVSSSRTPAQSQSQSESVTRAHSTPSQTQQQRGATDGQEQQQPQRHGLTRAHSTMTYVPSSRQQPPHYYYSPTHPYYNYNSTVTNTLQPTIECSPMPHPHHFPFHHNLPKPMNYHLLSIVVKHLLPSLLNNPRVIIIRTHILLTLTLGTMATATLLPLLLPHPQQQPQHGLYRRQSNISNHPPSPHSPFPSIRQAMQCTTTKRDSTVWTIYLHLPIIYSVFSQQTK